MFHKFTELRRKCKLQSISVLEAQDDTATTQRSENAAAIHKGYTTGDLDAAELSVFVLLSKCHLMLWSSTYHAPDFLRKIILLDQAAREIQNDMRSHGSDCRT